MTSAVIVSAAVASEGRDRAALNYLRYFWDGVYVITDSGSGSFTARPCAGRNDILRARTAQQLGPVIRDHYGRPVFRSST